MKDLRRGGARARPPARQRGGAGGDKTRPYERRSCDSFKWLSLEQRANIIKSKSSGCRKLDLIAVANDADRRRVKHDVLGCWSGRFGNKHDPALHGAPKTRFQFQYIEGDTHVEIESAACNQRGGNPDGGGVSCQC